MNLIIILQKLFGMSLRGEVERSEYLGGWGMGCGIPERNETPCRKNIETTAMSLDTDSSGMHACTELIAS